MGVRDRFFECIQGARRVYMRLKIRLCSRSKASNGLFNLTATVLQRLASRGHETRTELRFSRSQTRTCDRKVTYSGLWSGHSSPALPHICPASAVASRVQNNITLLCAIARNTGYCADRYLGLNIAAIGTLLRLMNTTVTVLKKKLIKEVLTLK
jgi:hypothetical protein